MSEKEVRESYVPVINSEDDLKYMLDTEYVIEAIMVSDEFYDDFFETMYNLIRGCFTKPLCREYPVRFRFYHSDKEVHIMQFRHFITNLILWRLYVCVREFQFLNDQYIMDGFKIIREKEYDLDTSLNLLVLYLQCTRMHVHLTLNLKTELSKWTWFGSVELQLY